MSHTRAAPPSPRNRQGYNSFYARSASICREDPDRCRGSGVSLGAIGAEHMCGTGPRKLVREIFSREACRQWRNLRCGGAYRRPSYAPLRHQRTDLAGRRRRQRRGEDQRPRPIQRGPAHRCLRSGSPPPRNDGFRGRESGLGGPSPCERSGVCSAGGYLPQPRQRPAIAPGARRRLRCGSHCHASKGARVIVRSGRRSA